MLYPIPDWDGQKKMPHGWIFVALALHTHISGEKLVKHLQS